LSNTIVAGNTGGDLQNFGSFMSSGYNLIGDAGGPYFAGGKMASDQVGTDAYPLNPLLAPLSNYGGPTETMALLPGSPALGKGSVALAVDPSTGNPLTTDQRGSAYARVVDGAVDIGAFETQDTNTISGNIQSAINAQILANPTAPTVTLPVATDVDAQNFVAAINLLGPQSNSVTVQLNLAPGTYSGETVSVPTGMTLVINGQVGNQLPTTVDPATPALTVVSGSVVVSNVTFVTTGDAPTILVTGGSLTLRNDIVQESTGFADAAISITGGAVDLGTAASPGGNTLNVNGTGTFILNTTANPIPAVGDTFERNGQATAWPAPLTVVTTNSIMLVGNNPPPLTGFVNGTPFTGTITYTTAYGDQVTITLGTTATSASAVGQYAITATLSGAAAGNYVINPATSTTGTMYVVSLGADPTSTTGAKAVIFWDNKGNAKLITAADLSSLDALNLVTQGGAAFDPRSVAQLQAWLSISPKATTAYQLAVQLAVLDLNVLAGYVQATDLVFAGGLLPYAGSYGIAGLTSGGFLDVQALMQAANAVLGKVNPGAPSGDPNQAYEAALSQVLQAANGNSDFVRQDLLWSLLGVYQGLTTSP